MKSVVVDGSYTHTLNIPDEWEFSELKNVINLVGGNQPPKSKFLYEASDNTIRLIQIRDYKSDQHKVFIQKSDAKRFVNKTDVMIGRYGPPIFQILRGLEGAYNVALMKAEPVLGSYDKDFLYYYLSNQDIYNYVNSASDRTAGQSGVNKEHLEKYPVPVVPLAEQQEIVRQLDVMLAQVEQIKARLDAIPAILKKFRQSVLADAVSGKLTEEWRANNIHLLDVKKDYSSLIIAETNILNEKKSELKKIKEEKFKLRSSSAYFEKHDFSCPLGWKVFPFFELALLNRGFDLPNSARVEGKYPILSAGGLIGYHNEYKVEGVCVTVGRSGSVGRVFISEKNSWPLNTTLYVKDFGFSNPSYVYWVLKSMNLEKYSSSTAVPSLNRNEFMFEPVAIPPIKEQLEILKRVEQFFKYSEYIESLIQSAQKRVNLLTQSILAKAFSGELTAEWREQHQDLITGVNSAESLLAKIQAEREASKPVKKAKKVK